MDIYMKSKRNTVYRIIVDDFYIYVGRTNKPLYKRLNEHLRNPVNPDLKDLIVTQKLPHRIEELKTFRTHEGAVNFEKKTILKLYSQCADRLLNKFAGGVNLYATKKTNGQIEIRKKFYKEYNVVDIDLEKVWRCSQCKKYKSADKFHRDRTRFNGLHSKCKDCKKHQSKLFSLKYKEKNKYPGPNREGYKKCCKCRRYLLKTKFNLNRVTLDGHMPICIACCKNQRKNPTPHPPLTY